MADDVCGYVLLFSMRVSHAQTTCLPQPFFCHAADGRDSARMESCETKREAF